MVCGVWRGVCLVLISPFAGGVWGCRLRMGSSRSVPGRHPIYRQPTREASAPIVTPAARTPPQHPLSSGWCVVWVWVVWVWAGVGG